MPHLIHPLFDIELAEALAQLKSAHSHLGNATQTCIRSLAENADSWGVEGKRLSVDLRGGDVPTLIGKEEERLTEVINLAATIERLIAAIQWFSESEPHHHLTIRECHPTTSDGGNDLILQDSDRVTRVLCEVCDVASSNAGANGKEKKDISSLGCSDSVPDDGIERYICTSPEFAAALSSSGRKWKQLHYRYETLSTGCPNRTCLLKLVSASNGKITRG